MKVIGIFRGFPGLGRVVAGVELLQDFKRKFHAEVVVFSYFQGLEYAQKAGMPIQSTLQSTDISSIGIIPVSAGGENIIQAIGELHPDLVFIDGEPLLLVSLRLTFPWLKIVTLLNPFDVNNPHNKVSSQLFFKDCYAKADMAIVHGLWKEVKPAEFKNVYHSIHTIIRKEVKEVFPERSKNKITCVLGGGTVNSSKVFFDNTINIAKKSFAIAACYKDFSVEVLCGSRLIYDEVLKVARIPSNVIISKEIKNPKDIYTDTKLVIARAGRNTISELLYLNMPSILFATSCNTRGSEQEANLSYAQELTKGAIAGKKVQDENREIIKTAGLLLSKEIKKFQWDSGSLEICSSF